jgi:hypothetical protein
MAPTHGGLGQVDPDAPAQFAFDKGRLVTIQHGMGAGFVVSASNAERDTLTRQVMRQLGDHLDIHDANLITTIVEKRATFACTPALTRPHADWPWHLGLR